MNELIKNFAGKIIGIIETDDTTGNKIAKMFSGKIVAKYNKLFNTTNDFAGKIISQGDITPATIYNEYNKNKTNKDKVWEGWEVETIGKQTCGYILPDGVLVENDEYHGDDYDKDYDQGYVEYSSTHLCDDTCIRIYTEPTEAQYNELKLIIDKFLNWAGYCKVEIWSGHDYYRFYKIYSLYENACEDDSFEEVVGNWTGEKLIQIIKNYFINNSNSIDEALLNEATRNQLLTKSRKGDFYSDAGKGNRWTAKSQCKIANNVRDYNRVDMDTFWKRDILNFDVKVQGKTDTYDVTVEFNHILKNLQNEVKKDKNQLTQQNIYRALMASINNNQIKVSCTCLHEDTKIKLLDGTSPTIKELTQRFIKGEDLWCYSVDENGIYKPGKIERVWKTKTTKEFIKVTLDNNQEILCTPEHLFMLRTGEYCCAEDLKINQSLMPLYFKEGKNGYDLIKDNLTGKYKSVYKETANILYQEQIKEAELRALQDGSEKMNYSVAIHHKNFNKHNNNPDNLQVMTAWEHWNYHANLCGPNKPITEKMRLVAHDNAITRNSNPTDAMIMQRKKFTNAGRQHNYELSAEELEWRKNNMKSVGLQTQQKCRLMTDSERKHFNANYYNEEWKTSIAKSNKKVWANYSEEQYKNRCYINHLSNLKAKDKISEGLINWYKNNPEKAMARFRTRIKNILLTMVNQKIALTFDNYAKLASKKGAPKTLSKVLSYYPELQTWNDIIRYYELNHKVMQIERIIMEDTDVYDIKVSKWHNFLLNAGVIVHNCPDFKYRYAYTATKNGYKAGDAENRPSKITNPNDTKGSGCKHILAALNNAEWLNKIASVINNYANYCKDNMEYNYAKFIFPNIYGIPYQKAVQMCLDNYDENGDIVDIMKSDQATINLANALGKVRGRFHKGSNKNPITQQNKKEQEQINTKQQNNIQNK